MIERIYSALFLLLISSTFVAANAADTTSKHQGPVWVDPGWRRTVSRYTVTFDEQGLSTTVFDFEIQALDEKGAQAISQQSVTYNGYFDELTVDDLATLKADGSVIAVDDRAVRDQPASADTSSPYFDERRNRIIAYSICHPRRQDKGAPDPQGKAARFRWRVCALLEPAGRSTARVDRAYDRWAGFQAVAYRGAERRAQRREVGQPDRSSCAPQTGDAEAAPDGHRLIRRRSALRGQHLRGLCRLRCHAECPQRSDGGT